MTEFQRDFIKKDPIFKKLLEAVVHNHRVQKHTQDVLLKNKHIEGFCEEARHFVVMDGKKPLHIHYDTCTWFDKSRGFIIKVERIGVYEDFLEYEVARLKGVHSTNQSTGANLN